MQTNQLIQPVKQKQNKACLVTGICYYYHIEAKQLTSEKIMINLDGMNKANEMFSEALSVQGIELIADEPIKSESISFMERWYSSSVGGSVCSDYKSGNVDHVIA